MNNWTNSRLLCQMVKIRGSVSVGIFLLIYVSSIFSIKLFTLRNIFVESLTFFGDIENAINALIAGIVSPLLFLARLSSLQR